MARSFGLDLGAALLCVLVFWLPLVDRPGWSRSVHAWAIVLLIVGMLLRSRWSVVAFCLVTGVTLAGAVSGMTHDPFVAAAWTLFPVAVSWGSPRLVPATSVTIGLAIVLVAVGGPAGAEETVRYVMVSLLVLAGTWALGSTMRRQRRQAEHALRAEKEHAVTAERLRVAREVHDIVSHSLGTISVVSGVARQVGDDAGRMREKLAQIETTSREALDELRAALVAVRDPGEGVARGPQPGIDDLRGLVERVEHAGIAVNLTVSGCDRVPPGPGLAVYRIAQEGLTNVTRYAPGTSCQVAVVGGDTDVRVEIVDTGPANGLVSRSAATGSGFGLVGLRERVRLMGGALTAGRRAEGGFALRAVVPLGRHEVSGG
ncbi:histidine kinase [Micromonospora sp. KC606]|uniref:sensor histidine kinase n=1 Tax=Micromonospora sp. KC606 TaxID=2530379 RepID=UPI0014043020|nr:histidine kinase [Micromonospora sp. KC606]